MIQGIHKLLIVEPNAVIALGLEAVIKRSNKFRIQITLDLDLENIISTVKFFTPDIILINPILLGTHLDERFVSAAHAKIIAITMGGVDSAIFYGYDATINLAESSEVILQNLLSIVSLSEGDDANLDNERLLSPREKDVVAFVAKGLTNKEISSKLSISIHTVITHRRNIAKKLKIHSPSGLTIYAIVNKLVNIDEIHT